MTEEEIFAAAIGKKSPAERDAFLDGACAADPELRRCVAALLKSHDEAGNFLIDPPVQLAGTIAYEPITETVGSKIGPYKLLQQIGEGGFGVVFMAEQHEPVRRKVALKIIKPGMDTKEVIARFESERQALALMDHPNIAKVLDAGTTGVVSGQGLVVSEEKRAASALTPNHYPLTTSPGRPYFVMELVKGVAITEYCDKNNLPAHERLELFVTICHAVQHAHHKGIIHRDIKPSNIMVTLHDGRPVPKVIDFGVAKATSQQLTERTLFTAYGQMIGTPAYMSPEQAEMSGLDIDTRSDIYALGVLLYELLTGSTPFDAQRLRQAGYAEMQRIIREEPPPKPSTRLSTLGGELTGVASHRGIEPKKLRQLVSGDLDVIVMKSLEKDRNRRYETPNSFAADIERFLNHEAIEARAPSTTYRLRKFAQRNKVAFATAAVVAATILIGSTIATWQAVRATRAEAVAVAALDAKEQARRDEAEERNKAVVAAAAESEARTLAQAQVAETQAVLEFVEKHVFAAARPEGRLGGVGRDVTLRQALDAAEPAITEVFADRPLVELRIRQMLRDTYEQLSDWKKSQTQSEKWVAVCDQKLQRVHPAYHGAIEALLGAYERSGRWADRRKLIEDAYNYYRDHVGPSDPNTLHLQYLYARLIAFDTGREAEARALATAALTGLSRDLAPDHPYRLELDRLAAFTPGMPTKERIAWYEDHLRHVRARFSANSDELIDALKHLGRGYAHTGRPQEGAQLLEEGFRAFIARYGPDDPRVDGWLRNLHDSLALSGRVADSAKLLEEYLPRFRERLGPEHHDMVALVINLTDAYLRLKRFDEIPPLVGEVLAPTIQSRNMASSMLLMGNLGYAYFGMKRSDAVPEYIAMIDLIWRTCGSPNDSFQYSIVDECSEYLRDTGRGQDRVSLADAIVAHARELQLEKPTPAGADAIANWEKRLAEAYLDAGRGPDAAPLIASRLEHSRSRMPTDSIELASELAWSSLFLIKLEEWPEAERLVRECLAIREKATPDDWRTFSNKSQLGAALLGQNRRADAEPLLLAGYAGMHEREAKIPAQGKIRLTEALQRLIDLYTAWDKPDDAAKWRTILVESKPNADK